MPSSPSLLLSLGCIEQQLAAVWKMQQPSAHSPFASTSPAAPSPKSPAPCLLPRSRQQPRCQPHAPTTHLLCTHSAQPVPKNPRTAQPLATPYAQLSLVPLLAAPLLRAQPAPSPSKQQPTPLAAYLAQPSFASLCLVSHSPHSSALQPAPKLLPTHLNPAFPSHHPQALMLLFANEPAPLATASSNDLLLISSPAPYPRTKPAPTHSHPHSFHAQQDTNV